MVGSGWDRVPIDSQSIDAPLSRAAVFLTLTVAEGHEALQAVAGVLDGLDDLIKTVGFRDLNGPKGGVDHACTIEVALRDGTRFRAEARAEQILTALDDALGRLVRRIDSARKRQLTRRHTALLAFEGG